MAQMSVIKSFWLAFRPKTLTAALVPVIAATALAARDTGVWDPFVVIFCLLASFFIQIGTNLINDWADFKSGADTKERVGPTRVTQSGLLSERVVLVSGLASFALAVVCGIPLVVMGGLPIVLIGVVSLICGYAYTAGPFPLAYHGLGDLFVILFFGIVAVCGTYFLHTAGWSFNALWLGLQIGFLATALIAINNLRDVNEDQKSNKNTLAVRFGKSFVRAEIALLVLIPFVMNLFYDYGLAMFLLPALTLPLAIALVRDVYKNEPSPIYNSYLARAAGIHLMFGGLMVVALCL